jgi:hypothetical protein
LKAEVLLLIRIVRVVRDIRQMLLRVIRVLRFIGHCFLLEFLGLVEDRGTAD